MCKNQSIWLIIFLTIVGTSSGWMVSPHRSNIVRHRLTNSLSSAPIIDDLDQVDKDVDNSLRFLGVGRLYENEGGLSHREVLDRLGNSTVAIVGLGGVGSWSGEALARSGIGNLILVDLDEICSSNINRQLHALSSTVGKSKIEEMKARLHQINPMCNITLIHDFITVNNAQDVIDSMLPEIDVLLDAIDGQNEKAALIAAACRRGISVVTCGGAAGRTDPSKVTFGDLSKCAEDRLLKWVKKSLRSDEYSLFPKGPSELSKNYRSKIKKWNILAVFSTEVQKSVSNDDISPLRRCDGALGTACFVTGTYGFTAASLIVDMIANNQFKKPRITQNKTTE